jgi:hypothetical protein
MKTSKEENVEKKVKQENIEKKNVERGKRRNKKS